MKKERAGVSKAVKEGTWETHQEDGEFSLEGPILRRYDKSRREDPVPSVQLLTLSQSERIPVVCVQTKKYDVIR